MKQNFNEKEINYKRGLDTVEAELVTYRKNEYLFSEEVAILKREVGVKTYEFNMLKIEFEKVKQEKEGNDFKIEKFENASKDLDKQLGSQITDNSKKGLGYSVVPPPHPLIYNRPNKLDLSYSGLEEFQQPEFEVYGLRANKSVCENSSNETKKNSDAPLIEEWVSDNEDEVESPVVVKKKIVFPTAAKIEFVRPKQHEKPVRKPVKYAEMYRSQKPRGNQRNWNNLKSQQSDGRMIGSHVSKNICTFSYLKRLDFIDAKEDSKWTCKARGWLKSGSKEKEDLEKSAAKAENDQEDKVFRRILISKENEVSNSKKIEIWRYKRRCCSLIPAESNSLPHAHAQAFKIFKVKKDRGDCLLDEEEEILSFKDKYEHVGQKQKLIKKVK
ncbi:hypothetical protein Tco_0952150 [Tanacetum coccineum]|uniref:Uncharacterized protein n=1 Tax=Tanacetum coccineum TaxID=301880 RepID=A0ABQ5DWJ6_9ASTR